jgi:patatin-like phospholipase/acyl hydrolase
MYKILSIDGGGMHGYADLIILQRIVKECPKLLEDVDLIAGTSIGGIIGLGLALGHKASEVDQNFIRGIPLAFNTNPMRLAGFYAGICPKYDNRKFKVFLRGVYGPTRLGDLEKKVVIPVFCLDDESPINRRWRAKIFHNFQGDDCDGDAKLVDVAMATSAVPVFFPTYDKYVDGALIANNPALVAVAQTQDVRNTEKCPKMDEIVILSVGTIRDIYIEQRDAAWGYFMWSRSVFHMITERDTLVINHMAKLLMGERYHRIEPVINGPMDEFEAVPEITQVGHDYPLEKTIKWVNKYWV